MNPFKKSDFHPTEVAKRVFYREDGSGRDGYIMANNGGLTVSKMHDSQGSDPHAVFARQLRGYQKDRVTPGYHRVSMPLRVADNFIERNLRVEEAEMSGKYQKQVSRLMQ